MQLLDGKYLSGVLVEEVKVRVAQLTEKGAKVPGLVALLVGENPASQSYVRNKMKLCEKVGFQSKTIRLNADISQEDLLLEVKKLNEDQNVDGFIVQLPLPKHINETEVTLAIDPKKDVDGFHPINFGKMAQGLPCFLPATPFGILQFLERYNIDVSGKKCVVLGRSNIVGSPISILLSRKATPGNATVTLCHSRTKNIEKYTQEADIIVAALGIPNYLKADMVKEGAVIIDVGINRIEDASRKSGYKLVGDVDFESVAPKSSFITPVPGGVGPMTVMSLIMNTMLAAENR